MSNSITPPSFIDFLKSPGTLVCFAGLLHIALGLVNVEVIVHLVEVFQNGFIFSVFPVLKRMIAFRYLINGIIFIFLGFLMNCYVNDSRRHLPSSVGWGVILLGLFVCLAVPSNLVFWGITLVGVYIVYLDKNKN